MSTQGWALGIWANGPSPRSRDGHAHVAPVSSSSSFDEDLSDGELDCSGITYWVLDTLSIMWFSQRVVIA